LISAQGREVTVAPRHDFAIYSRKELAAMMRQRAVEAGARLHVECVERTGLSGGKWHLETSAGGFTVDFLVGADGASSVIRRRVGVKFGSNDFAYALGWNVRDAQPPTRVDVKYLDEFSGYLWLFPRTDHISYGIASGYREATPAQLKAKLLEYIATQDAELARQLKSANGHSPASIGDRASFYAAMIPALDVSTWDHLKVSDAAQGWALIGDAAGFVDPLTGEGIYYAIKSADLLADALTKRVGDYEAMWRADFGAELRRAAELSDRFYYGSFAGAPLTERMVQFARRHRGVREVLRDLVAGDQGYVGLKSRLLKSALLFS
jgi:flavin-dependent dehydrogenase